MSEAQRKLVVKSVYEIAKLFSKFRDVESKKNYNCTSGLGRY